MSGGAPATNRPSPRLPILGHLPFFLFDRLGFLRRASQLGDVARLRLGEDTYLLNNADDVRHVFVTNAGNYDKTWRMTSRRGKRLSGEGVLTSFGAEHRRKRKMLQPHFHRKVAETFASLIIRMTDRELNRWPDEGRIDLAESMMRLAQSVIIRTVLGSDFDDPDDTFAHAVTVRRKYMEYIFRTLIPFGEFHPVRINFHYRNAMQVIDETIHREIKARRNTQSEIEGTDFLSRFTTTADEAGNPMTDREIRDEAVTLLVTGYETVGVGLAWTLYLLSQNDQVHGQVREEVFGILGGSAPEATDYDRLPLLQQVYAESLRLYPPTWITVRFAIDRDELPSGASIPGGAKIYLSEYAMHHNPKYWPEPDRFDPSRFAESSRRERPPLAYFPFGAGARVCIGEPLARLESILALARIIQRAEFRLATHRPIIPDPRIILWPKGGIPIHVNQRQ